MRVAGVVAGMLCAACYSPSPRPGAPCTNGACPTGLVCSAATQTCELVDVDASILVPDAPELDAMVDAEMTVTVDAPPDAPPCYGGGLVTICPSAPVTDPLAITASTTINTATSTLCVDYTGSEENLCVVAATAISIDAGQQLRAVGPRPLVLLATTALTIDGTLDASSGAAGANPAACTPPSAANGGQGGAGGSWQGRGGSGGGSVSGLGPASAPGTTTVALRGGCAGGSGAGSSPGAGGNGGGAVYLIAASIAVNGSINASGQGGRRGTDAGGGGGGGSGGFIGFDSPAVTVAAAASVFANGGGGGEGGTPNHNGNSGTTPSDPSAASGGSGGANHGGNGGSGAAGTTLDGSNGRSGGTCNRSGSSGGGGGGGAGLIYVYPAQMLGGTVSPPAA